RFRGDVDEDGGAHRPPAVPSCGVVPVCPDDLEAGVHACRPVFRPHGTRLLLPRPSSARRALTRPVLTHPARARLTELPELTGPLELTGSARGAGLLGFPRAVEGVADSVHDGEEL